VGNEPAFASGAGRILTKLPTSGSCQWEPDGGNDKTLTALGDAFAEASSDRGSTPLASTIKIRAADWVTQGAALFILSCNSEAKVTVVRCKIKCNALKNYRNQIALYS